MVAGTTFAPQLMQNRSPSPSGAPQEAHTGPEGADDTGAAWARALSAGVPQPEQNRSAPVMCAPHTAQVNPAAAVAAAAACSSIAAICRWHCSRSASMRAMPS